ncbi:hypothetical protein PpBr36_06944 [Pyricularia pennisetigena]|uniref:hypothetical protein n=1 Tax=Pyricularia pennisetigena TaxID=1578925 RepID=UPI0011507639|nr:hypothetical protein PpBr36_06944 [Pyricularia pennisetigena]TLS25866.1 hypothetical protein PpBr36_06944 [Pyricularia pennisetigena]
MYVEDAFSTEDEDEHEVLISVASAHLWSLGQANGTGLEEILGALSKLSTDELCALKEVVDRKIIVSEKVDILALLPEDLRIGVLEWLGPEDFWPCLQVSGRWRRLLLDAGCIKVVCRDLHPGLLEMVAQGAEDVKEATPSSILDAQMRAFKEASFYSFSWHKGDFATVFFQRPWLSNIEDGPNQQIFGGGNGKLGSCPREERLMYPGIDENRCFFGDSLYSSGRLVCQPYWNASTSPGPVEWFLIVDDFATRTRRTLRVPQIYGDLSKRVRLFCVGDSLVVARDLTHRRLAMWSLSEEEHFSLARLPRRIDQAVTAGNVVVGTYRMGGNEDSADSNDVDDSNGMAMWRWTRDDGGRVVEWTLAEPANFATELIELRRDCVMHVHSILIHPRDESIFYLFIASLLSAELTTDEPDPEPVTMAVFEVIGKQISGRWKTKLHTSWLDELSDPGNYGFRPIDRHGSYSTATRQREGPQRKTLCHEKVVFNIYTKQLTLVSSVVPLHSPTNYGKTLLWEGKYITWQEQTNRGDSKFALPLVITPSFTSEKSPLLSPRPLNSVPHRRFPFRHECDSCKMPAASDGGKRIETRSWAGLGKYTSLHQTMMDLTPRLINPKDTCLYPRDWWEVRNLSTYLTETYAGMQACRLDSAMFCGEGLGDFDGFPLRNNGNHGPVALRHALTPRHQQPPSEILTWFPLMWIDGRYMVLSSWEGYMVWEFRSPRIESPR